MRKPPWWLWAAALRCMPFLLPLLIVVVYSFNDSRLNAEWLGITFKWYAELVQRRGHAPPPPATRC